MIYEFALEPKLVASWHHRKQYLFFHEKFGLHTRRLISAYPKKWIKLVWKVFSESPYGQDQNAQIRMAAVLTDLRNTSVKRKSTFPQIEDWLERAETEHRERPFRAIIASDNPNKHKFVVKANDLIDIDKEHGLWSIPDDLPIPRNAIQIAKTVSPIIKRCQRLLLIDPYFDPNKLRFRKTLEAILFECCTSFCNGLSKIELHTSIDRFFEPDEKGDNRKIEQEKRVYKNFVRDCNSKLPKIVPEGITLGIVVWKQRENGEKLHNRYILTNIAGVMLGTGIDQAENQESSESDDFAMLSESQCQTRLNQYSTSDSPSAFDLVDDEPIQIAGMKKIG